MKAIMAALLAAGLTAACTAEDPLARPLSRPTMPEPQDPRAPLPRYVERLAAPEIAVKAQAGGKAQAEVKAAGTAACTGSVTEACR